MYMLFILILCLFIFLFCLYILGREDFTLIRKNVFLEQLFNLTFAALIFGLFTARLVYVLAHWSPLYLNPLVFLVFPYYPGLSLIGGIIGAALLIMYVIHSAKFPLGRLFDFLFLSLFCALPFGYLFTLPFTDKKLFTMHLFLGILYALCFGFFIRGLYPKLLKADLKDGSIALIASMTLCFLLLLSAIVRNNAGILYFMGVDEVLAVIVLFFSTGLLIKQEYFDTGSKKYARE